MTGEVARGGSKPGRQRVTGRQRRGHSHARTSPAEELPRQPQERDGDGQTRWRGR
jgi:ribosomal protein L4